MRHNGVEAATATRDKQMMRRLTAAAGLPTPRFAVFPATLEGAEAARQAAEIGFPCVVKPTRLSGSRGVIRADDEARLGAAYARAAAITRAAGDDEVLIEGYVPGAEFALEGLLSDGALTVLAIFDKPDPLDGPYFEETIYVTPSRAAPEIQVQIAATVAGAAQALGLREGAVHGEVRVNTQGVWLIEVAGRSIGGLCGQTLRFAQPAAASLEELILRQALGWEIGSTEREQRAGGVMMIPIPGAGVLTGVEGLEAARAVPGVESVEITARLNYPLTPLPEGESYLGFIFARADAPSVVEAALRTAHAQLRFEIDRGLMVS
jgi:biotin carboxylase